MIGLNGWWVPREIEYGLVLTEPAVVVVDAKGLGSLRRTVETLAAGLPFQLVAPGDPKSLRYNPCNGTPAQISNKLMASAPMQKIARKLPPYGLS